MDLWGRDEKDGESADDERASHSILRLGSGPLPAGPSDPSVLSPPSVPPTPSARPARTGPPEPAPVHSFLNLPSDDFRPIPTSEPGSLRGAPSPAARSFLGLESDAGRPLPGLAPPASGGAKGIPRSVLGLSGFRPPPPAAPSPAAAAFAHAPSGSRRRTSADTDAAAPRGAEDPTRGLFVEIERRPDRAFPVERAILISLAVHIVLLFIVDHIRGPGGAANPGLLAALRSPSSDDNKIPIVFRAAPGPERNNPKRSDPSDKNRVAGGGDRSKPKADTPFVPERPGKEGLSPGSRMAAAPPPSGARSPSAGAPGAAAPSPDERVASSESFRPPAPSGTTGRPGSGGLPNLNQAIERAAQSVGASGDGGAGTPNPEGGFMDSGPLSFETSWYDWGAYADEMVRRIKLHWDIPKLAELGWKGKLTIHFSIRVDGSVEGATIVAGSGIPPYDFAALQAILKSNPFRPLPKDLLKEVPGKEKEGVTVTFFYNMRPEDEYAGRARPR